MLVSSGSADSPYDCVSFGNTTCTLHFVPSVPDSINGLFYHTHLESTYNLALMLSTAFTIKSFSSQKQSSNNFSLLGLTYDC